MKKDIEFNKIIADIIKSDKFITLKDEDHHGISRLEHSLNVAKVAYRISKKLKLKKCSCSDVTRAALLHDLFNDFEIDGKHKFFKHPSKAAENAVKYFSINGRQKNAIEAHMFPTAPKVPKYTEGWIVTISDKMVAVYEMLRYKAPLQLGSLSLLLINLLSLPIYPR